MVNKQNGRVINVSSSAYQFARKGLDFEDLNSRKYGAWDVYGKSKVSVRGGGGGGEEKRARKKGGLLYCYARTV